MICQISHSANLMEKTELSHRHGKARVRIGRVWRGPPDVFVEWNLTIALDSDSLEAYTLGDNTAVVATDSIKNTVYALAKQCGEPASMEDFGTLLAKHFLNLYLQVTKVSVLISEKPWRRISVNGSPHDHGFKLGQEKHTAEVTISRDGHEKITSGIKGLSLLKTTKSGFVGFVRDKYTLLPEVDERMLASEITATWSFSTKPCSYNKYHDDVVGALINTFFGHPSTGVYSPSVQNTLYLMAAEVLMRFPKIDSVKLNMPNLHFVPVNMPSVGAKFDHDIYLPMDEPHGTIEACLTRKGISSKL